MALPNNHVPFFLHGEDSASYFVGVANVPRYLAVLLTMAAFVCPTPTTFTEAEAIYHLYMLIGRNVPMEALTILGGYIPKLVRRRIYSMLPMGESRQRLIGFATARDNEVQTHGFARARLSGAFSRGFDRVLATNFGLGAMQNHLHGRDPVTVLQAQVARMGTDLQQARADLQQAQANLQQAQADLQQALTERDTARTQSANRTAQRNAARQRLSEVENTVRNISGDSPVRQNLLALFDNAGR